MQELKNAGFEDSTPNNWETFQTGTMQIYTYPEPGRISGSSVSIEYPTIEIGQTAMWAQNVYVDHNKTYKLSGWLRTLGIIGTGASIKVDWKNALGEYLSRSTIMTPQKGTTPWTYVEGDITPDQNAVMATVNMELYDCSGKAWFDDISFSETVPGAKYKCSGAPDYICTVITDGTGTYNTLAECQAACRDAQTTDAIIVTYPNGGESFVRGIWYNITWNKSGSTLGPNVKIELLKAGTVVKQLVYATPNDGIFAWQVPIDQAIGTDYKIRITGCTWNAVTKKCVAYPQDVSNGNFSIKSGTVTTSVTIVKPANTDKWQRGTIQQIKWTYAGNPGNVSAHLYYGVNSPRTYVQGISSGTPAGSDGTGSFNWNIPSNLAVRDDYYLTVGNVSTADDSFDWSDRFEIIPEEVVSIPVLTSIEIPTHVDITGDTDYTIAAICKDQNGDTMNLSETLTWNIVDGGSYITITPTGTNTARIHGIANGIAHVAASYGQV